MSLSPAPVVFPSSMHHAPVGAWASLVIGAPGRGIGIAQEHIGAADEPNADLLVALQRESTEALPLIANPADYPDWKILPPEALTRRITPCIDEFSAPAARGGGLTLRIFTPHAALPNPKRSGNLQYSTAPGLLLELVIDNSTSDAPATAFLGMRSRGVGRVRPVDWSSKTLCGIAGGSRWMLAANAVKGDIFTLQSDRLDLAAGQTTIDPRAQQGGIAIKVPPRTTRTVALVFAAYHPGLATQGLDGRYLYTHHFPRIETVAHFILQNHARLRESCTILDARAQAALVDPHKLAILSRALRAYEAGTQVIEAASAAGVGSGGGGAGGPSAYFATIAPAGQRNALERAVDHLPWELYRNPWVIRNLFDLGTTAYAYHDQVRFPTDSASPDEPREGGMTFARDFGYASGYAPGAPSPSGPGTSAFDGGGTGPGWSGGQLATESLLNAVYLLTSYALLADDTPWAKTRLPFARELLTSMENRDHWDPEQRTGILKAESLGSQGDEQTAFAGLDPLLASARGNLYLGLKTFCATLMLTTYFQNNNDLHSADYSYAFAQKTAQALTAAFDQQLQILPANLLTPTSGENRPRLLAALEPLAVPTYLGLTTTLAEYFPELYAALKAHAESCLKPTPEGCLDATTGTLRLVSTSGQTMPAKVINILYVLERLFQLDPAAQVPALWANLAADDSDPARMVTAALYMKLTPTA